MNTTKGAYSISIDKTRLDIDFIHGYLTRSYWAEGIAKEIVARAIRGSICFGVYNGQSQIGFARVITDGATFGYLADVFIDEGHRGNGLGKWLIEFIVSHPELQGFRRMMLATRDAHGLYAQFGFTSINNPERFMLIHNPDVYKKP